MARETEALQLLFLTPEGGSYVDDVIELLYFSQQTDRALVVLLLSDPFFFSARLRLSLVALSSRWKTWRVRFGRPSPCHEIVMPVRSSSL